LSGNFNVNTPFFNTDGSAIIFNVDINQDDDNGVDSFGDNILGIYIVATHETIFLNHGFNARPHPSQPNIFGYAALDVTGNWQLAILNIDNLNR